MADAKKPEKTNVPKAQGGKAPAGGGRPRGGGQQAAPAAPPAAPRAKVSGDVPPRIRDRFRSVVIPALMK